MKGFIKFASIMACCVFCFIGGVAHGDGENHVAAYCVVGGFWLLFNGYAATLEMETNELVGGSRKKTTKSGRKST